MHRPSETIGATVAALAKRIINPEKSLTATAFQRQSPGNGTNPLNYTSRLR